MEIAGGICTFMLKFNYGGTMNSIPNKNGYLSFGEKGKMIIHGRTFMSKEMSLNVDRGLLDICTNFFCNRNCAISCNSSVDIGQNNMLGWDVVVRDSDNHQIIWGVLQPDSKKIQIGDNVWIAAHAYLLKGAAVADGCIIEYRSLIIKKYHNKNSIIAGNPPKLIKENIVWYRKRVKGDIE